MRKYQVKFKIEAYVITEVEGNTEGEAVKQAINNWQLCQIHDIYIDEDSATTKDITF